MSRSVFSFYRAFAVLAMVLGLALSAGGRDSAGQQPQRENSSVPVTGAEVAPAARQDVVRAPEQQQIFSGQPAKMTDEDLGLGTIFRLETNSRSVPVIPAGQVAGQGYLAYKLGAGYRLVISSNGGMIVPPAGVSTGNQQVDLGGGDTLVIRDGYARVIPPSTCASSLPLPHDPNVSVQSIGGGFWLVSDPNGAWIWQE